VVTPFCSMGRHEAHHTRPVAEAILAGVRTAATGVTEVGKKPVALGAPRGEEENRAEGGSSVFL
jgi:hypothetical protein